MLRDSAVPLADDSPGCDLERDYRNVQNGQNVYSVSLNRGWLSQLGIKEQGAPTVHAIAMRPVVVQQPCYVIQPAEVVDL